MPANQIDLTASSSSVKQPVVTADSVQESDIQDFLKTGLELKEITDLDRTKELSSDIFSSILKTHLATKLPFQYANNVSIEENAHLNPKCTEEQIEFINRNLLTHWATIIASIPDNVFTDLLTEKKKENDNALEEAIKKASAAIKIHLIKKTDILYNICKIHESFDINDSQTVLFAMNAYTSNLDLNATVLKTRLMHALSGKLTSYQIKTIFDQMPQVLDPSSCMFKSLKGLYSSKTLQKHPNITSYAEVLLERITSKYKDTQSSNKKISNVTESKPESKVAKNNYNTLSSQITADKDIIRLITIIQYYSVIKSIENRTNNPLQTDDSNNTNIDFTPLSTDLKNYSDQELVINRTNMISGSITFVRKLLRDYLDTGNVYKPIIDKVIAKEASGIVNNILVDYLNKKHKKDLTDIVNNRITSIIANLRESNKELFAIPTSSYNFTVPEVIVKNRDVILVFVLSVGILVSLLVYMHVSGSIEAPTVPTS
ncbi:hypothetical protein NEOKW01_1966 [Nematocida sp. AWRm80]|nr:hypothetical protein NEOKW01_1966 [Nematocida sp. AWRm80]